MREYIASFWLFEVLADFPCRLDACASRFQIEATNGEKRADFMIRDLEMHAARLQVEQKKPSKPLYSIFGNWLTPDSTSVSSPPLDLTKYTVRPRDVNKHIPENIFLIASARSLSWGENTCQTDVDGDAVMKDVPLWVRKGDGWWPAAQSLREALNQLPGKWIVFFDTDHLAGSPLTKLALGSATSTVIPMSLDEGDFARLFDDVTSNALVRDVLIPMKKSGQLSAHVRKFIFNRMSSAKNEGIESSKGVRSPFTPPKVASVQMDAILEELRDLLTQNGDIRNIMFGAVDEVLAKGREFGNAYFSAFKTVPDTAANASKLCGAPIAMLEAKDPISKEANLSDAVLAALKEDLQFISASIIPDTL